MGRRRGTAASARATPRGGAGSGGAPGHSGRQRSDDGGGRHLTLSRADQWDTTASSLLTYLLSFVYVGIYWNNHHHLFQLTERVSGGVLWANLHLLFWLSLFPFSTAWMDRSHFSRVPVMGFGIDLLGAAIAYAVLQRAILRRQPGDSLLARAVGRDLKGKASPAFYIAGLAAAAVSRARLDVWIWVALAFFAAVAVVWLVPDRRIERALAQEHQA